MIRWTTPTLGITIPNDIVFDYLILTFTGKKHKINKEINYSDIVDGRFKITMTQEETKRFVEGEKVEVMINYISNHGESRLPSNILELEVGKNLLNEVVYD